MTKYLEKKRPTAFLFLLVIFICALSIVFLLGILLPQPQTIENRNIFLIILIPATILIISCGILLWSKNNERLSLNPASQEPVMLVKDLQNEKQFFASILSHDLRSPLSSIVLLASYIKSKDEKPETLRYIELIEQSARKELEMMATLLALMRADSFKPDHVEEMDLSTLVTEALQDAELQLAKKSLKATADIAPGLSLWADPENLKLILRSLISQAICYSDKKQPIEIKASQTVKTLTIELRVLSEELHRNDHTDLFQSDRLAVQNTGNAFPDCIHFYFLGKAIQNYNGTIHVQREENNPASRFILTLELLPQPTA